MSKIVIFTDGSSRNNPGPGGWGAIVVEIGDDGKARITELGGGEKHTTNNKMELMAAIGGICGAPGSGDITVLSDSSYVIKGITDWIHGWKRNDWRTSAKKAVLNKDLWMKLDECTAGKAIRWKQVAGHAGVAGNERCDQIATGFADDEDVKLYEGPIGDYHLKDILKI